MTAIANAFPFAEFFPAGKIIPQRILKGPRKHKHKVVFGSDAWAINTPMGYVLAVYMRSDSDCAIKVVGLKNMRFYGSPYSNGGYRGYTSWIGNTGLSDDEWVEYVSKVLVLKGWNK